MNSESIISIETEYTPCSIEFCPSIPNLGTCGQYQTQQIKNNNQDELNLNPKTERLGKCILFQIDHLTTTNSISSDQISTSLPPPHPFVYHQIQSFNCPAILDQKWTEDVEQPILFTADSDGHLNSYKFKEQVNDSSKPQLELIQSFPCSKEPTSQPPLCLAIDISDKIYKTSTPKIVCSLSNGEIILLDKELNLVNFIIQKEKWYAHDFEPWCCAFDYWQTEIILTGGDDCKLKVWDTRNSLESPVLVNKQFDGGVTAIRSHHLREHIFAVGSYDSGLRIFDKRNFKKEILNYNSGGGIWRIKWHPNNSSLILLANMHDGFKVISITDQQDYPQNQNQKHDNFKKLEFSTNNNKEIKLNSNLISHLKFRSGLAYGTDWGPSFNLFNYNNIKINSKPIDIKSSSSDFHHLIASCSFYDKVMHLWFAR